MSHTAVQFSFSDQVLSLTNSSQWSAEALEVLKRIERNLKKDLQAPVGKFFSETIQQELFRKAAGDLANLLTRDISASDLQSAWQQVATDFHRSQSWGFQSTRVAPEPKLSEQQKIKKELTSYIVFLVVVLFLVKSAFYIFGMLGANYQDEPIFTYGFWISLVILALFTGYFVWKKLRAPQQF
jgi:hypothetical protein